MLPVEEVVVMEEEEAVDWLTNISLEPESTTGLVGEETRGVAFALGVTSMNFVIGCLSSRLALFPPGLPTHCSNAFWVSPDTAMEGPRGTVTGLVGEKGTWGFTARGLGDVMAWTSLAGGGKERSDWASVASWGRREYPAEGGDSWCGGDRVRGEWRT